MKDNTKTVLRQYCIIAMVTSVAAFLLAPTMAQDKGVSQNDQLPVKPTETLVQPDPSPEIDGKGDDSSQIARITWFGRECNTTWCQAHKNLPREKVVAVNVSKYGYPKRVYIPKWEAWYDVIEKPYTNTDGKTDIDVWCLDDVKCQQQVAIEKNLMVKFVY
jgi:hypothetical protein